jgi:hypothetical protein
LREEASSAIAVSTRLGSHTATRLPAIWSLLAKGLHRTLLSFVSCYAWLRRQYRPDITRLNAGIPFRSRCGEPAERFAHDSALEESGFEPSVPLEKSGRSETRASARCIAQPTGAAANDIAADDRQAAGDQIIATRLRRRSCR